MEAVDTITKDYVEFLFFGLIAILVGITSFYVAYDRQHSGFVFAVGAVFVFGGIALIAKGRWRLRKFRELMAEGERQDVWISVHNTGSGDSSATSCLVKVYPSKEAQKSSLAFEVNANRGLRAVMERKERKHATLLKREGNTGMVIIYVDERMILPSSDVRYFG